MTDATSPAYPTLSHSAFSEIPVVDISGLYSDDPSVRQQVGDELARAACDVGFLYISGHPIPASCIDALINTAKAFFALPLDVKMKSYIGLSDNHSGYVPEGEEQFYGAAQPDHKEAYDIGFELQDPAFKRPILGTNQWPELAGFRETVTAYYAEATELGNTLFRGFALALGLPEETLTEKAVCPPSQLRMVHYPFDPAAADRAGIGAHTDYECFTLLLPTCDGLEVLNGAGEWVDAPVRPGCFVVNIGDMLETLSNGRFVATSHRVRKVQQERYSFPLFFSLDYDTCVEPILPPLEGNPADRYAPLICGDHIYAQTIHTFRYLQQRLAAGTIRLPESAQGLASFGQFKSVMDATGHAGDEV